MTACNKLKNTINKTAFRLFIAVISALIINSFNEKNLLFTPHLIIYAKDTYTDLQIKSIGDNGKTRITLKSGELVTGNL